MFYQTTSEEHDGEETVAASHSRGEMLQGPASTVSVSSSSLKGTEGQRHRGARSGAYGSQESNHSGTRPPIGGPAAPRRLLLALLHHTCHTRLGLVEVFPLAEKAKADYAGRRG